MDTAAVYIRVSRDKSKHGKDEIYSPEAQLDAALSLARAYKWDLPEEHIYQDLDYSGYKIPYKKRPGLMRLLADAKAGRFQHVIVYKLSRLSRRIREFHEILTQLERFGISVYSVSERFDTDTPAGRLLRNILVDFAQYESEEKGEWIYSSHEAMVKDGVWRGGHVPYGLIWDKQEKRFKEHAWQGRIVRQIFAFGARSISAYQIVQWLHDGPAHELHRYVEVDLTGITFPIRSPRGRDYWDPDQIYRMWSNPVYQGRLVFDGRVHDGKHDAIVPEQAVAEIERRRDEMRKTHAHHYGEAGLLTGITFCGYCGSHCVRVNSGRRRVLRRQCRRNRFVRAGSCELKRVDEASLIQAILNELIAMDTSAALADAKARAEQLMQSQRSDFEERRRELRSQFRQAEAAQARIVADYYEHNILSRAQFAALNSQYQERITALKDALAELDREQNQQEQAIDVLDEIRKTSIDLARVWDALNEEERRRLLHSVVRRINLYNDHATVDFFAFTVDIPVRQSNATTIYF